MKNQRLKFSIWITIIFQIFIPGWTLAREAIGKSGMVVTAHPIATEFGVEILKSGGNAIDAAVGAAIILGVVEPHASGFGGGGGMLIYLYNRDSLTYINYYARAPQNLPANFIPGEESNTARAVLVPGTVAGLYYALQKYGTITWKNLLIKVIKKLENGIKIDVSLNKIILDGYDLIIKYPQTSSIYLVEGFPPDEGQIIRNNRILKTLTQLAEHGPDVFYQGAIADSIEAVMVKYGGNIRKLDLMSYPIFEVAPVKGTYRGFKIFSAPPPQAGITMIEILNILEFQNLSTMGDYTQSISTFHFMAEAMKRGDADRLAYLGDSNFCKVPVDVLISKEFARSRFQTIDMQRAVPANSNLTPAGEVTPFIQQIPMNPEDREGSTTHISIVDAVGNAVSLTQTLNHFWGSGISVCGFLLNNGMTGFSTKDTVNFVSAGRQPRTTIAPSMVFKDKDLFMIIGSPGAGQIISTMVELMCNVIDFGKGAEEANIAPRFCSRKRANTLPVEARFTTDFINKLKEMGHPIEILGEMDLYFGGVQMILVDTATEVWTGSSDPRRAGIALGY